MLLHEQKHCLHLFDKRTFGMWWVYVLSVAMSDVCVNVPLDLMHHHLHILLCCDMNNTLHNCQQLNHHFFSFSVQNESIHQISLVLRMTTNSLSAMFDFVLVIGRFQILQEIPLYI